MSTIPPSDLDPPASTPGGEGANPVLSLDFRIPFHRIRPEDVVPGIRAVLEEARKRVEEIAAGGEPSYRSTVRALDRVAERVDRAVTPVRHLMSVRESPQLRRAYNTVLPEITAFHTWLMLHPGVWEAVRSVATGPESADLEGVDARHLEKTVRELRRAGADLDDEAKDRLRDLRVELSSLEQRFSENVLDATAAYERHVEDAGRLDGVPEHALERFRTRAREAGLDGFVLTLDYPSYEAVMKHAVDRDLREELHRAYTGRCTEGKWDNRETIAKILALRQEMAEILGSPHFPDHRLQEAMVGSGVRARRFLEDLELRTRPFFERDVTLLRDHAAELGILELRPWDVAFVQERLRRKLFRVDDEALRPYFPLDGVIEGLFGVAERVFGLTVEPVEGVDEVWHPDVRCYRVRGEDGRHLGDFYADLFPRKEKRQGAWMNDFITGGPGPDGTWSPHLGFIAGNFTPPRGDAPALLTHREVATLFHEFGHLLHHLCTRVAVEPRAGLNVAWDWVELPSQIMENWTWEEEAIPLFARHWETDEVLPEDLLHRLRGARRFMGGWRQMRQLGFGSLDLALHLDWATADEPEEVVAFTQDVLERFVPEPLFARRNILTTFGHLFSGGYAAGYYSYLWSAVLEADAFGRFRRNGIFDRETGRAFVDAVLSRGDSEDPDDLFEEFMGREPDPQALVERDLGTIDSTAEVA